MLAEAPPAVVVQTVDCAGSAARGSGVDIVLFVATELPTLCSGGTEGCCSLICRLQLSVSCPVQSAFCTGTICSNRHPGQGTGTPSFPDRGHPAPRIGDTQRPGQRTPSAPDRGHPTPRTGDTQRPGQGTPSAPDRGHLVSSPRLEQTQPASQRPVQWTGCPNLPIGLASAACRAQVTRSPRRSTSA